MDFALVLNKNGKVLWHALYTPVMRIISAYNLHFNIKKSIQQIKKQSFIKDFLNEYSLGMYE